MMNVLKKKRKGFTLVELIVVIAMIAILAGIAVPSYQGYRERANAANDAALIKIAENAILVSIADGTIKLATSGYFTVTISNDTMNTGKVKADLGTGIESGVTSDNTDKEGAEKKIIALINGASNTGFKSKDYPKGVIFTLDENGVTGYTKVS